MGCKAQHPCCKARLCKGLQSTAQMLQGAPVRQAKVHRQTQAKVHAQRQANAGKGTQAKTGKHRQRCISVMGCNAHHRRAQMFHGCALEQWRMLCACMFKASANQEVFTTFHISSDVFHRGNSQGNPQCINIQTVYQAIHGGTSNTSFPHPDYNTFTRCPRPCIAPAHVPCYPCAAGRMRETPTWGVARWRPGPAGRACPSAAHAAWPGARHTCMRM
eukprot:scaffold141247_cov23-Tisochrysis_lutea.AAC.2